MRDDVLNAPNNLTVPSSTVTTPSRTVGILAFPAMRLARYKQRMLKGYGPLAGAADTPAPTSTAVKAVHTRNSIFLAIEADATFLVLWFQR